MQLFALGMFIAYVLAGNTITRTFYCYIILRVVRTVNWIDSLLKFVNFDIC
jgi:hypothetical protein